MLNLAVYNYENITYHVTGMSVINDPKDTKQEGILIYLQIIKPSDNRIANDIETAKNHHKKHGDMDGNICLLNECALHYPKEAKRRLTIFLDKRDCAHIAKTTQESERFWKRFRLPKMVRQ